MASKASQTITAIQNAPATAISQRMIVGCGEGPRRCSIGPAAGGDVPHRLHARTAHAPHAIVEVERRVAVRREELDALPQPHPALRGAQRQAPLLLAPQARLHARTLHGPGREWVV